MGGVTAAVTVGGVTVLRPSAVTVGGVITAVIVGGGVSTVTVGGVTTVMDMVGGVTTVMDMVGGVTTVTVGGAKTTRLITATGDLHSRDSDSDSASD